MIHITIGTKAQFIKMAPVIREMQERKIPFNLIDLGQHPVIAASLRSEFGIREPDLTLGTRNVSSLKDAGGWFSRLMFRSLSGRWLREAVFKSSKGVCLIHGDTLSTIVGLIFAKRAGLKVAHIEAGLRSYNWLEPFPEELLRLLAMRFSDILFAPSKASLNSLISMGLLKRIIELPANTGYEALKMSMERSAGLAKREGKFCLVTLHRVENIYSRRKMNYFAGLLRRIALKRQVVFVQHQPTINSLKRLGLYQSLESSPGVSFYEIISHASFCGLLKSSEFVITDGGSIQEECFYLDKPCLLLRGATERSEGIGENVCLSGWDPRKIETFLSGYGFYSRRKAFLPRESPSKVIVDSLQMYL